MYHVYRIEQGDTLESIARKFNTNNQTLRELNGFGSNVNIVPNNYIVVPAPKQDIFQTYIIKKGDNMYEIARRYQVDYNDLLQLNGLDTDDYIYPDQEILVPTQGVKIYVTKEGDTLNFVSSAFQVRPEEIIEQNENLYLLPEQLISYKKEEFN